MPREGFKHGFPEDQWNAAKEESTAKCGAVAEFGL